jgi:hypothetical protein
MKEVYFRGRGRPAVFRKNDFCRLNISCSQADARLYSLQKIKNENIAGTLYITNTAYKRIQTGKFVSLQFLQAVNRGFISKLQLIQPAKIEKSKYCRHHLHY